MVYCKRYFYAPGLLLHYVYALGSFLYKSLYADAFNSAFGPVLHRSFRVEAVNCASGFDPATFFCTAFGAF